MKIDRITVATLGLGIIFLLLLDGVSVPTMAFAQSEAG
jgi:hypothetical protein